MAILLPLNHITLLPPLLTILIYYILSRDFDMFYDPNFVHLIIVLFSQILKNIRKEIIMYNPER